MLGTFIDTIVVCTMTALVILTSGAWTMMGADGGGLTGAVLTSTGFQASIPGGKYIVTIALAVFAFTTILGWSYYGERCWQYLFREKSLWIYRGLWVLAALAFANVKVDFCLEPVRYAQRADGGTQSRRPAAAGADGVQGDSGVLRDR